MRVDPEIRALRVDRAPQARAQAAMVAACNAWRGEQGVDALLSQLGEFGQGAQLEDCPVLDTLFTGAGAAEGLIDALCRHFSNALQSAPFGHPPFRQGFNGTSSTLLLASTGRAQLLLQAREPGNYAQDHDSVCFSDALRFDAVVAGSGQAQILRCANPDAERAQIWAEPIALAQGARLGLDCQAETLLLDSVDRRLVTLRLHRTAQNPLPTREYCRATGRLLHQASGDLATSRKEMMAALLGRMQRVEAAPVLKEMALEKADDGARRWPDNSLRWQALRECLALDTAQGFGALSEMARREADPLAAPAGALRAQLIEQHPQLLELESPPCPAS